MIEIPLTGGAANAHQELSVQLGDHLVDLKINWVTRFECWTMDVSVGGVVKMAGVMLLPSADLSESYRADLGRWMFDGEQPTLDNLGQENRLVWIDG